MTLSLHKQQTLAFESEATEILYGGSAGGGKSHMMRVSAIMWCVQIPNLQVYIFRRLSDDLIKNHLEGPTGFPVLLSSLILSRHCKINYSNNSITFWNGAKIHLCHCQYESSVTKYQGAEIHVLMIDELTHFTEKIYRFLRGRVRLGGLKLPAQFISQFPRIVCGSNPGSIGHNWVKLTFIDIAPPMQITERPKKDGGMKRQFIPARLADNPTLTENDPDYIDRLEGLGNEALVKAMKEGDWNIVAGGAFDDVWSHKSVIEPFNLPESWRIDRSFDWGSAHPFAVAWFAECDGTEAVLKDGVKWAPVRGSLILIGEWYGAKDGTSEGLKMSAKDVATGIVEREKAMMNSGFIKRMPKPGPADNQIDNVTQPGTPTIASEMLSSGVRWESSDKSPGSRKNGLELMRQRIKEASKDHPESPCLYFMNHCRHAISQIPILPRDTKDLEDVDTKADDHMYDAIRYRVLSTNRTMKTDKMRF